MDKKLKAKVEFEIFQIDKLLESCKPLSDICKTKKPDFIEISAATMVLHSFYNGIESILVLIFKYYNEELPKGINWHIDLLNKAFSVTENRKEIFNKELNNLLEEYLRFRHFARHVYGFKLEWTRMELLFNNLKPNWEKLKEELNNFIENNKEPEKEEAEG